MHKAETSLLILKTPKSILLSLLVDDYDRGIECRDQIKLLRRIEQSFECIEKGRSLI